MHPLSRFFLRRGLFLLLVILELSTAGTISAAVQARDQRGVTISLPAPARRIVCLIESALSGLYMLGAESQVVGVSTSVFHAGVFPYYAAMDDRIRLRQMPAPGNWDFVNLESVLALQPDLVILWSHQQEMISALEGHGIPVFGVFIQQFSNVYEEIVSLGTLTGREARAQQLVAWTQNRLKHLREGSKSKNENSCRVYFMWPQGELETSGGPSTVNELIQMAGGQNVAAGIAQEHVVVNREQILSWNPDMIVMWHDAVKNPPDIQNTLLSPLGAVKQGRVFELPDAFSCDLWTLKFYHAIQRVAAWCAGDAARPAQIDVGLKEMLHFLYEGKLDTIIP